MTTELDPYERWMVRSNLHTAADEGIPLSEQARKLRAYGYERVAAAVESATDEEWRQACLPRHLQR